MQKIDVLYFSLFLMSVLNEDVDAIFKLIFILFILFLLCSGELCLHSIFDAISTPSPIMLILIGPVVHLIFGIVLVAELILRKVVVMGISANIFALHILID
jgi:hypothetical protein